MFLFPQMNFESRFMTFDNVRIHRLIAETAKNGLALLSTQRTMHFHKILL